MDQPEDNARYLRKWAADIRKSSGKSVDADRLDSIADEIASLRTLADERFREIKHAQEIIDSLKMEREAWFTRPAPAFDADKIAMVLSEELTAEDSRVTNVGYVAVKLAGMAERGELQPL